MKHHSISQTFVAWEPHEGLVKQIATRLLPLPSFWFSRSRMETEKLHFQQVPSSCPWYWCRDYTLRTIILEERLLYLLTQILRVTILNCSIQTNDFPLWIFWMKNSETFTTLSVILFFFCCFFFNTDFCCLGNRLSWKRFLNQSVSQFKILFPINQYISSSRSLLFSRSLLLNFYTGVYVYFLSHSSF